MLYYADGTLARSLAMKSSVWLVEEAKVTTSREPHALSRCISPEFQARVTERQFHMTTDNRCEAGNSISTIIQKVYVHGKGRESLLNSPLLSIT